MVLPMNIPLAMLQYLLKRPDLKLRLIVVGDLRSILEVFL